MIKEKSNSIFIIFCLLTIDDDVISQLTQAVSNLYDLLWSNSSGFEKIAKLTVYLTDPEFDSETMFEAGNVVYFLNMYIRSNYSVSVVFTNFTNPKILVQLEVTAFSNNGNVEEIKSENVYKHPKYAQGTKTNLGDTNMIFLSAQMGLTPNGSVISSDPARQAEVALDNLKTLLEQNGSSFENVTKTTLYLADVRDFSAVNAVYARYFTNNKPARQTFPVKAMLEKGAKLQLDIVAFSTNN